MDNSTLINIGFFVLIVVFFYWQFGPVKGLRTLNAKQFGDEMSANKQALVIDVREVHEFKNGAIRGAMNVPLSVLHTRLADLPNDRQVLLYCQSGMRSKRAAKMFLKQGFKSVSHLSGGIMAWNAQRKNR